MIRVLDIDGEIPFPLNIKGTNLAQLSFAFSNYSSMWASCKRFCSTILPKYLYYSTRLSSLFPYVSLLDTFFDVIYSVFVTLSSS